jgi:putative hydrolase of HD superfamily
MDKKQITKLLSLLIRVNSLKEVDRTGWVNKGVKNAESVADHSWGVAFLALILANPKKLNKEKLLNMIIIHDIGEIIPGDVVWEAGKKVIGSQSKKRKKELDVIKDLFEKYPGGKKYIFLLKEFNEQKTPEARFLKRVEKLEMGLQAFVYEKTGRNKKPLTEFWENVEKYLEGSDLEPLFRELQKLRKK